MTYTRFAHSLLTFTIALSSILKNTLSYQGLKRPFATDSQLRATTPKEIIFYIHGWQRAPVALKWGSDKDLAKAADATPERIFKELPWREQAYSYDVRQAQHRIWANTDGFHDKIISDIYQVLEAYPKVPFRLTAHSLGCQLALKISQRLINENNLNKNYWPRRIALLEPAFVKKLSQGGDDDSETSRDKCIKLLELISTHDVAIEIYRSSVLTRNCFIGHSNQQLVSSLPYPSIDINYPLTNWFNLQETHNGAKTFYFRTFITQPHTICGTLMPYAGSPTEHVLQSYGQHFEQIVGGAHGGMFLRTAKEHAPAKCPLKNLWNFFTGSNSRATLNIEQKKEPLLFTKDRDQNIEQSNAHARSKVK